MIRSSLSPEELKDSSVRDAVSVAFRMHAANTEVTAVRLMTELSSSPEGVKLVSEAASVTDTISDKEKAVSDCISKVKKDNLKDKLDGMQQQIKMAHARHDEEAVNRLVLEYSELVKTSKA
jgi:hypothetical protein